MPLISLDDDDQQRWVPTHVNVTVLRARRLRTKGKHGSRYVYTIIQVGKEKYTTGLVEKAEEPQWGEECSFELLPGLLEPGGGSAYPLGSSSLVLTVMHRVLIGLDVFLGQAVIPLDKVFQEGSCPRNEWLKLHSKAGRKEKERGELQVTVQFTRNNMTASMYDLTVKDKPRSAFGKLKDRVTGKKRDVESSSAILPGRYAALSGSVGPPFAGDGGSYEEDMGEEQRSKVKDFFLKGKLRKNSDTRSCSSIASDSSMASSTGDPFIPVEIPRTPVYSSRVMEPFRMDTDGEMKAMSHKRAYSDEASKIMSIPRSCPAVENIKDERMTLSNSTLCINGSHVYSSEQVKSPSAIPAKRSLLEKCAPLSRSLQNLTRRGEDLQKGDGRSGIEKANNDDGEANGAQSQTSTVEGKPVQATGAVEVVEKGKKQRKTLFSSGRSDSLPAKPEHSQVSAPLEARKRGWFVSGDSQNKPRLGASSKVESTSETSCPILCSPKQPPCSLPLDSLSTPNSNHPNPFTSSSPTLPSISPSNPFLTRLQQNPFFEDLIAEDSLKSPTAYNYSFSYHPVECRTGKPNKMATMRRERPRSMSRQRSLPIIMNETPDTNTNGVANHSVSEKPEDLDDFEAFASSRLKSPNGTPTRPPSAPVLNMNTVVCANGKTVGLRVDEVDSGAWELPPLPPQRPSRTQLKSTDSWLNRAQELAVKKEACCLSQTDFASYQHAKDGKRNLHVFDLDKELTPNSSLGYEKLDSEFKIDEYRNNFEANHNPSNGFVEDIVVSSESEYTIPETLCFPSDWETTVDDSLGSSPQTQPKHDSESSHEGKMSKNQNCKEKSIEVSLLTISPRDSNNNTNITSEFAFIDSVSSQSDLQPDKATKECPEVHHDRGPLSPEVSPGETEDIINRIASELEMFSPKNDLQNHNHYSTPFEGSCKRQNVKKCDQQNVSNCDPCILVNDEIINYKLNTVHDNTVMTSKMYRENILLSSNKEEHKVPLDSPHVETHSSPLEQISFEDLHARVAPRNSRSPCTTEVRSARIRPGSTTNSPKIIQRANQDPHTPSDLCLHDPSPSFSELAQADSLLHSDPSQTKRPSMASTPTASASPEEMQTDNVLLPPVESSPHPVKPLTNSTVTVEKKAESRSVLEKLKSSISPQRTAPASTAENEKKQLALMEARAQYQNMTNMELIALLLQQEMDMEKQQAETEQQVALLEKRDTELKKMKVQVRDLEDYIDKLLVQIMEQTPTLLQVRARPK